MFKEPIIQDLFIIGDFKRKRVCRRLMVNKPRTAKVGAISKAQKCKRGDPSGFVKLQLVAKHRKKLKGGPFGDFKNSKNEIFEQCHSAEKCKRRDLSGFFDIHCVAKYRNK